MRRVPRWMAVAGALSGAAAIGVVGGLSVAGDMPKLAPPPVSIQPSGPEPPADAFARDAGYAMAKALRKRTMVSCETLKPVFRAGCRDYVRDSFRRSKSGADAGGEAASICDQHCRNDKGIP